MLDPLLFKDGTEWKPDWRYEQYLKETYTNLGPEWQKMRTWMISNPAKCPAKSMKRFVGNWMNKGGVVRTKTAIPADILERNKPVDKSAGRKWIAQIKQVLRGRQPGEDL